MFRLEKELQNQHKIVFFLSKFIATGFFSGYSPIAPGTVGSVVAILIYWFFIKHNLCLFIVSLIFFVLGIFTSSKLARPNIPDPSNVVIDEIVGMWISLFFIEKSLFNVLIAFFIFRAMDILKPPPARKFDRMKGGFAIMMDDVVAGLYANILTQIAVIFLK